MRQDQTPTQQPGTTYERARGDRQTQALSLLLTGQRLAGGGAVEQFRAFADEHAFSVDHTWIALEQDKPVASVMIVPSAGRTGMIFMSPIARAHRVAMHGELVRAACAGQLAEGARLIQSLLDPAQKLEADALRAAGFDELATLLYMQKRTSAPLRTLQLDPEYRVYHWSESHRHRFAAAIMGSYQETRDCPGLLGLRHIDDIIAGHRATGDFDPHLWFAIARGSDPVAVMLLNKVPQQAALELVYLGLSPAFRGKGIARRLLDHGLGLVTHHGYNRMLLAVDDKNTPALTLYKNAGFTENGRKIALIYAGKS